MLDKAFFDTNILIYSYSEDEQFKQDILEKYAKHIIISKQVINELVNILPIVDFDLTTQIKALHLKERYKLQFYDALIVATALENDCNILYSEDMQYKQVIDVF